MTDRFRSTITEPLKRTLRFALRILLVVAIPAAALAHGGFDHIRGTIVKVANNVLTVKTANGNVDVKLDSRTELTRNDQKADVADLQPGARVIVDVPEGSKDKIAHSVKIGAAPQPAARRAPTKK